ncbi:hypothetical protein EJ08DRAFT_657108 [Tothia fuscella]|uniref:Uncharacterized protein n=1 Tax=Tothia fuscella TaxID=1048955 RepID=A0A9P4U2J2_9PEZI|nr:hypothetical protein EJ08DRAFT_657108 [Tothia fuscella]
MPLKYSSHFTRFLNAYYANSFSRTQSRVSFPTFTPSYTIARNSFFFPNRNFTTSQILRGIIWSKIIPPRRRAKGKNSGKPKPAPCDRQDSRDSSEQSGLEFQYYDPRKVVQDANAMRRWVDYHKLLLEALQKAVLVRERWDGISFRSHYEKLVKVSGIPEEKPAVEVGQLVEFVRTYLEHVNRVLELGSDSGDRVWQDVAVLRRGGMELMVRLERTVSREEGKMRQDEGNVSREGGRKIGIEVGSREHRHIRTKQSKNVRLEYPEGMLKKLGWDDGDSKKGTRADI